MTKQLPTVDQIRSRMDRLTVYYSLEYYSRVNNLKTLELVLGQFHKSDNEQYFFEDHSDFLDGYIEDYNNQLTF